MDVPGLNIAQLIVEGLRKFRRGFDNATGSDTWSLDNMDPIHDPEIRREAIVGYRGWRYEPLRKVLTGCYFRSDWPAGEAMVNVHGGNPGQHSIVRTCEGFPHKCFQCGIHAFKDEKRLRTAILKDSTFVLGRVALWGQVVEHEDGWRASHAYPQVLYYSERLGNRKTVLDLCEKYGCEGIPMPEDLETYLWDYYAQQRAHLAGDNGPHLGD